MSEPKKFSPSPEMVPVKAVLPENRPGSGALLIMRDGSFRLVCRTGSVNFDMKAPLEQASITYAFGALVNTLTPDFQLQIVSHSKRLDVDAYVRQFDNRLRSQRTPPKIRELISSHCQHFEGQVKQTNLLTREIYVVLPYKSLDGPFTRNVSDEIPLFGLFRALTKGVEKKLMVHDPTDLEITTARQQLELRLGRISDRLADAGIYCHPLDETGIKRLLYEFYNPTRSEIQRDPGMDADGSLLSGFSAESLPIGRGRISEGAPDFN
jgi:hypothetical protein